MCSLPRFFRSNWEFHTWEWTGKYYLRNVCHSRLWLAGSLPGYPVSFFFDSSSVYAPRVCKDFHQHDNLGQHMHVHNNFIADKTTSTFSYPIPQMNPYMHALYFYPPHLLLPPQPLYSQPQRGTFLLINSNINSGNSLGVSFSNVGEKKTSKKFPDLMLEFISKKFPLWGWE